MSTNPVVVKYTCERQTEIISFVLVRPFASLHSLASSDLDCYKCLLLGTGSIA